MNEPPTRVLLDPAAGRVLVRDPRLAASGKTFAARALACQAVNQVDFDLAAGTVELRLATTGTDFARVIAEVSAAIRSADPVPLPADTSTARQGTIRRIGRRLTTWRVGSDGSHRLRFRHPRMRRDRVLARSIERIVVTLPGVHDARLSGWASDLVVHVDPVGCDADAMLAVLQQIVDERSAADSATSPWAMAGKSATLGVLAATDLALPVLAPVSGLLLVAGNLGTIAAAGADLRRFRIGPATVATAIICGTLTTGQFLAAGIMAWSFDFWRRRHRRDVEAERALLLEDAVPSHPRASAAGSPDVHGLPGTRLPFQAWDVVPADARILTGGGVIDDRAVTGVTGVRSVGPGDVVPAGAVVLGGKGELALERSSVQSRVAGIVRLLASATELRPGKFAPTLEADRLVGQFAGPTLATAGLGLLAGDVATAVAVMRPDYGSAEAMSLSFEDLDAIACGLSAGCLLASPRVLDSLVSADTLVILDHAGLGERELEIDRVETFPPTDDATQTEFVRIAAGLARHVAGPRREALARLAAQRGCVIADVVPDSFGDERGVRIVQRGGAGDVALCEPSGRGHSVGESFMLEIAGAPRAIFRFRTTATLRASRALERIAAAGRYRLAVAAEPRVAEMLPGHELLPCEPEALSARLEEMRRSGRRLVVIGPSAGLGRFAAAADVAVVMGLDEGGLASAGVVCLPADLAALADLLAAASDRRGKLASARRLAILPNAACVAGAFLFGFTSVVSAIVTNLGTFETYRRASSGLHRQRRRHWVRQRALVPRLTVQTPDRRKAAS